MDVLQSAQQRVGQSICYFHGNKVADYGVIGTAKIHNSIIFCAALQVSRILF
jgi:hypothetical protein